MVASSLCSVSPLPPHLSCALFELVFLSKRCLCVKGVLYNSNGKRRLCPVWSSYVFVFAESDRKAFTMLTHIKIIMTKNGNAATIEIVCNGFNPPDKSNMYAIAATINAQITFLYRRIIRTVRAQHAQRECRRIGGGYKKYRK